MDLSSSVLGSNVVSRLQERRTAPVLRIGADAFTRRELAVVECFNFQAAANLSNILNKELQVRNTRDVFEHVPPGELALPRLGAIAIAVLGAAFEAKGVGGDTPLEAWVRRHAGAPDAVIHTFVSLKIRDAKERATERKDKRERKAARRDTAHRLRRDRFEARHKGGSA